MGESRGQKRRRRGGRRDRGGREWVGGRLTPPFFVAEGDAPYRPGLVLWMDVNDGLVVSNCVVGPEDAEGAVGRSLRAAMEQPLAGPPRRPDRVRVAEASLVAEVREVLGGAVPIDVAPTPELDEAFRSMLEFMAANDEASVGSYLEGGRIPPAVVADLFEAARVLYEVAPWTVVTDDQVLRMDIPELGVEGACVAVIGSLGESLGLLIFPSLSGYEAFGEAVDEIHPEGGMVDLGSDFLALEFERGADLPVEMRREVAHHGWPVADASAYPRVCRYERDGAFRPLVERDLQIATACAGASVRFFEEHWNLFEMDELEPISESLIDDRGPEVRFTIPYEAFALFEAGDSPQRPASAGRRIGRNDPCPCGSGRKYKKCHLAEDEAERAESAERMRDHDLDGELSLELGAYATERFGLEWRRYSEDFFDPEESVQLGIPWSLYHYSVQGRTVLDWYLAEHGRRLSRAERGWLAAQQAAWLSVWEVIGVEAGETVTLRDLISHEERCVREKSGSQTLVVRDAMLARVVDHEGVSLLCGAHPRPLPPFDAAEVVRRARGRLRRKRAVPVERLRDEAFGRYLIARWEEAVDDLDLRVATPAQLRNTDGDALLLTTDHFAFEAGDRGEIERRLAGMEGVEAEVAGTDPEGSVYTFLAPGNPMHASWENTLLGRACLERKALRVETNSRERADALRARVEDACGDLVRHRVRDHVDPLSAPVQSAAAGAPREAPPPEAEQLILEFKHRHYREWPDHPLPALGGISPREAVQTADGRQAVDTLLKEMENMERRAEGQNAFDFGELRRALRID